MNLDEQTLLKEAQLGIETEAFIASDLGKYLIERADEEYEAATNTLIYCNASGR